ncbi:hypothetical protein B0O99DRAFT_708121 [Bisporella sp. PMI_857]|nr:hypothetical protein B0O99DRAFT_708121 [Bisporella sp. PMI_857]
MGFPDVRLKVPELGVSSVMKRSRTAVDASNLDPFTYVAAIAREISPRGSQTSHQPYRNYFPVSTRPTLALDSLKQKETEYEYAISQYSRAISSLKLLLSSKLSDGSHYKIALITAICFIAIENLQGDLPTASRNMAGALSIAIEPKPDYVQCLKNRGGIPDYNAIDDELLAVFADLDMQTTLPSFYGVNYFSYGMPLVLVSLPCMPSPEIPTEFPNIGAAKTALMQIHALLTRLHSQSPHHLASKTTSSNEYKGLLDQWKTAFAPLFQQAQDIFTASYDWPADPKAYIPFFILSSNHALATIIACTNAGNCPEMFYDNMMPEFQRIINYSEIIVDALCSRSPSIFTFEVGVLPPLYVAGAKCRDPKLRRKAIALMRQCPSQEGVWQGSGSAQICEWVMEIEEIGAVNGRYGSEKAPPDYAASIPESDRVKWSSMKCGLCERRVTATRTAMVSVVQGSHRLWERSFTW